jgi:hypothetical protein
VSTALLVQERKEGLLIPLPSVVLNRASTRGNELDRWESLDAVLRSEGFGRSLVGVEVSDLAAVVAVEGFGDLGPGRLEGFTVAALIDERCTSDIGFVESS